jgi:threonine dehydrogenase-like Zn-dependent dehydrogenase
MKVARLHGVEDVRLDEIQNPEPGPRDAIVRVVDCGICGSDVGYVKLGGMQGRSIAWGPRSPTSHRAHASS